MDITLLQSCSYCGASPLALCRVTLLPEGEDLLSIEWHHKAREH